MLKNPYPVGVGLGARPSTGNNVEMIAVNFGSVIPLGLPRLVMIIQGTQLFGISGLVKNLLGCQGVHVNTSLATHSEALWQHRQWMGFDSVQAGLHPMRLFHAHLVQGAM